MQTSSWHRDELAPEFTSRFPDLAARILESNSILLYPVYGESSQVGVQYELSSGAESPFRAVPTAPPGAKPLVTIRSFQVEGAHPGISVAVTPMRYSPPELTISAQDAKPGDLLCTVHLQIEGVWPMRGRVRCGGPASVAFIQDLQRDLEAFGNPVELTVLMQALYGRAPSSDVLELEVVSGGPPATCYLEAQGVADLLRFYFDATGPVATYKNPVPVHYTSTSYARGDSAKFWRSLTLFAP